MTAARADRAPRRRRAGGDRHEPARARRRPQGARASSRTPPTCGVEGMLWGATLRSPHPHARIRAHRHRPPRCALPGVHAVLTADDVPGAQDLRPGARRPAGAGLRRGALPGRAGRDRRRRPPGDRAPRGATRSRSTTRCSTRVTDAERALAPDAPPLHRGGNLLRHVRIRHGDPDAERRVVVSGELRGRHAGPGLPRPGVGAGGPGRATAASTCTSRPSGCTSTATRSPPCLGLPPEKVRLTLGRRRRRVRRARGPVDADPRVHARAAHRPAGEDGLLPRGVVLRPRAPPSRPDAVRARRHARRAAGLRARRGSCSTAAPTRRSSPAVCANAACFARRARTRVPNAHDRRRTVVYTNNPPCGAMRGFGAVQACFAYEAQMDKLAAALGHGPGRAADRATRWRRATVAADRPGGARARAGGRAARRVRGAAAARRAPTGAPTCASCRAASPNTTHGEGVRRGVGYAVGIKNVGFSEGFDDYSTARVRRRRCADGPLVEVHTAAAEVGQGLVTRAGRRSRAPSSGVERVVVLPGRHRRSARPARRRRRARPT